MDYPCLGAAIKFEIEALDILLFEAETKLLEVCLEREKVDKYQLDLLRKLAAAGITGPIARTINEKIARIAKIIEEFVSPKAKPDATVQRRPAKIVLHGK